MVESVECGARVREIGGSIPGRVKLMTYKIDTYCLLAWHLALLGKDKDWFTLCQDNVTEWDIRSWYWWSDFPVGQHYKVSMDMHCRKVAPILIGP